jgi:hypothetical protein
MSIVSNHFPEVVGGYPADPYTPEAGPPADTPGRDTIPIRPRPIRKPRPRPARSIRLVQLPEGVKPGLVEITVGKETVTYWLLPAPSDFGRAFTLDKFAADGGERYAVNLNGRESLCECKGFLGHGHCKHVEGLQALVSRGKL